MNIALFGVIACVVEQNLAGLRSAILDALKATTKEIRLDALYAANTPDELRKILIELAELIGNQQTILTLRSKQQGGMIDISFEKQLKFWQNLPEQLKALIVDKDSNVFVDWEFCFIKYIMKEERRQIFPWEKVGCSLHFLRKTPDRLPTFLRKMQQTPARAFLKLVTMATKADDCQKIWTLLGKRNGDQRPLIAFAMGELGKETRFKCLSHGSERTYGFVPGRHEAAPGQVAFDELMADPAVFECLLAA